MWHVCGFAGIRTSLDEDKMSVYVLYRYMREGEAVG